MARFMLLFSDCPHLEDNEQDSFYFIPFFPSRTRFFCFAEDLKKISYNLGQTKSYARHGWF